jgi:hypothetical protein
MTTHFFPQNAENVFCNLRREISPLRLSKKYLDGVGGQDESNSTPLDPPLFGWTISLKTKCYFWKRMKCQLRSTITNNEKLLHRGKTSKLLIINYTNCSTLYLVYIALPNPPPLLLQLCKKKIDQSSKAKKTIYVL